MKVALLIESFGAVGGAENQAAMLASALVERGHSVHVYAASVRGAVDGVGATALGVSDHRGFAKAAKAALQGQPFDIVHSFARTVSQDLLRLGGGVHAEYLRRMEPSRSRLGRWFSRLNPKEKRILKLEQESFQPEATRLIQAVSARVREEVVRHYGIAPTRIVVTRNSVDLKRFHPGLRGRRERLLVEWGLPADAFIVLYVGTGFRRKGLDRAIEAAAYLPRDANAWLLVAGSGGSARYASLAKRRQVRARFLGARADIDNLYAVADALVLPTLYDPFPNVCLEAMASGVPVIVTEVAGVSEIITPGTDSFVVPDP
ncbi:MAG TPA: glycosyltransferase family 4 protein, partial [Planctomycetota bacterium]|nr:glycosyltransferase family 4 protein [Planctomycetota bacterium]